MLPSTVLLVGALGIAAAAGADETAAARAVIDETITEVVEILKNPALTTPERRGRIEAIALERFDFETMSRLVLKRSWRGMNETQRADFVEAFQDYLSSSYGGRLERYEQESAEVVSERLEPRGDVTVRTLILGGQADGVEVQYRLRHGKGDGPWRIIDVVIEGVSLVSNFHEQFQEVLRRDGPDELIRRLREKNAAADAPQPA